MEVSDGAGKKKSMVRNLHAVRIVRREDVQINRWGKMHLQYRPSYLAIAN